MVVLVGGEMSYTMLKVRGNIRGICPRGGEICRGNCPDPQSWWLTNILAKKNFLLWTSALTIKIRRCKCISLLKCMVCCVCLSRHTLQLQTSMLLVSSSFDQQWNFESVCVVKSIDCVIDSFWCLRTEILLRIIRPTLGDWRQPSSYTEKGRK